MRARNGWKLAGGVILLLAAGSAAIPAAANAAATHPATRTAAAARTTAGQLTASRPAPASRAGSPVQQALQQARQTATGHAGAGTITGSVVGVGGLPVSGACVTAVGGGHSFTVRAEPDGHFTLGGLTAGSYALEYRDCAARGLYAATWSGGAGWQSSAARVTVRSGQIRRVPGMMLHPVGTGAVTTARSTFKGMLAANARTVSATAAGKTGRISGIVTGRGKRLSGICVIAFNLTTGDEFGAATNRSGFYRIRFLPKGGYGVVFAPSGFCDNGNWLQQVYKGHGGPFPQTFNTVTVRANSSTTGISAKLLLGGEISGTVKASSGRKVGGICVIVTGNVAGGETFDEFQTGQHGGYDAKALFPGSYVLEFTGGCGNSGNFGPTQHRPISVTHGTRVSGLVTVLRPGATVTGTVHLGTASGTLLAGICVEAISANGLIDLGGATGPQGHYRIGNLGNGSYELDFSPGCNNTSNFTSVTRFARMTERKVTTVNAVLQPGAEISGTVTDASGQGVSGLCVDLETAANGNPNVPFTTNPDGTYVINQLDKGTYEVGFTSGCGNSGNFAPYWFSNQNDPSIATPITLATGQATTVNATLQPGATVSGTVTNASGAKLSGICVTVTTQSGDSAGANFGEVAFTADGAYSLPDLAPGQYLVDFGCGQSTRFAEQWFPAAADLGAAQPVSVPVGTTTVNAVLQPAGQISGTVTAPNKRPLAGVCVAAISTADAAGFGQAGFFEAAPEITGSSGRYQLTGLAAGTYHVEFVPCTGGPFVTLWYNGRVLPGRAASVTVQAGKATTGINAQMRKGGSFTGRVTGPGGKPVAACVLAFNTAETIVDFGVTDPSGDYVVTGLPTGSYSVDFEDCGAGTLAPAIGHVTITAPRTTTGVNAMLQPGGSVAGKVTLAGSPTVPVQGTCVEVSSANPANPGGLTFTDSGGAYLVTGLVPGTYQVFFGDPSCSFASPDLAPQWYDNQATQASAGSITVTAGQTTSGISAAVQFDGQITGSVTDSSGSAVSGACVTAIPQGSGPVVDGFHEPAPSPVTAVSGSGGYTLVGLAPGNYLVKFAAGCGGPGFATQWWQDASSQASATPVTVTADATTAGISATVGS